MGTGIRIVNDKNTSEDVNKLTVLCRKILQTSQRYLRSKSQ